MKHELLIQTPEIIRDFLIYMETVRGRSEKTVEEYYMDLRTFFRYLLMARGMVSSDIAYQKIDISVIDLEFISSVTLTDVYSFLVFCKDERGNAARTRARKTSCLRTFFKYLTGKTQQLQVDPLQELDSVKTGKSLPKYLTLEQSRQLLEAVEGKNKERDYAILTLFLNCGLRLSELCGLNYGDIRQDHTMRITGKGNKERIVYLNEACENALIRWMEVRPVDGVAAKDKNALFLSGRKRRICNKTVQHMVYQYLDKIGLGGQGYSVHKLRHTAATLMYQYGNVDVRTLQSILGHENLGTTEIYTHLSNQQIALAAESNPLASFHVKKK